MSDCTGITNLVPLSMLTRLQQLGNAIFYLAPLRMLTGVSRHEYGHEALRQESLYSDVEQTFWFKMQFVEDSEGQDIKGESDAFKSIAYA
eukprot:365409-Chlamydomonas_euryale.AAC.1